MTLIVSDLHPGDERTFKCSEYTVTAHNRSCFFCNKCTDIWYDMTNGPYMFSCEENHNLEGTAEILRKGCEYFVMRKDR